MGLSFDHSLLSKDKQRRLNFDVAREFLLATVEQAREQRLLSEEHFSVDGSLQEAGASVKNFRHRDEHQPSGGRSGDGGGSNRDVDFRGERRRYETHGSTTDPEARNGTGNLPNQPESIVNQTSGPGRSRQRVMLRRPQATHLHSTTQFQHPAKENQMTSNGELIWGVIVFSHLLMVLYCYLLGSHSLQLLSRKFDRKTREKYRRWKVDQDLLLAAAHNERDRALLLVVLDCGLRLGEVANLRRASLRDGWMVVEGKVGDRPVPVSDELAETLTTLGEGDHVWIGRFAKPLTQHGIQMAYKRMFLRAGISGPKIGPHTLRHTFATMYLRAGGGVRHLQAILGHQDIETTILYVHLAGNDVLADHAQYSPMRTLGLAERPYRRST